MSIDRVKGSHWVVMGIKLGSNVGSIHREHESQKMNLMGKKTQNPYVLCRHMQWNHTHPDVKGGGCNLSNRTRNTRKEKSSGFCDLIRHWG